MKLKATSLAAAFVAAACSTGGTPKVDHAAATVLWSPADGATGVALDPVVTARFSRDLKPASVSATTFLLSANAAPVAATIAYDDAAHVATLKPAAPLAPSTKYTASLTTGVHTGVDDAFGGASMSFTTLAVAPVVTLTPADGAADVLPSVIPVVHSTVPLDPATVTPENVALTDDAGAAVDAALSLSADGLAVEVTSTYLLGEHLAYTFTAKNLKAAPSAGGLAMGAPVKSAFTIARVRPTVADVFPPDGATEVSPAVSVSVSFSEPVVDVSPSAVQLLDESQALVPALMTWDATQTTATLSPVRPLKEARRFTIVVAAGLTDLDDHTPLAGAPYTVAAFRTAISPPAVLEVSPRDQARGVSGGVLVTVKFTSAMDPTSISPATVALADASGTPVPALVGLDETRTLATLQPLALLAPATPYTVNVTTGAVDYSEVPLSNPFVSAFTTAAGPTVVAVSPPPAATGVSTAAALTATFSAPVANLTPATFTLTSAATGEAIPAAVSLSGATATLTPAAPLDAAAVYSADLASSITDGAANRLTPLRWTFRTRSDAPRLLSLALSHAGGSPRPLDVTGASALPAVPSTDDAVVATFDRAMDPASAAAASVTDPAGNSVPSTTTVVGAAVTTTISALPLDRTTFAWTLGASAKSAAGVALAAPVTAAFTTAGPPRAFTIPAAFARAVPPSSGLFAVFDRPMSPPKAGDVTLWASSSGAAATAVAATASLDPSGTVLTVTPASALAAGSRVTLELAASLKDASGAPLPAAQRSTWDLGAAGAPPDLNLVAQLPADGAASVLPAAASCEAGGGVRLAFDGAVDPTSFATASAQAGGNAASGAFLVAAPDEVDFCPAPPLAAGATYALSFPDARSAAGKALASATATSFTLAPDVAPGVVSVVSSTLGASAATNTSFVVTFDGPVNPETLSLQLAATDSSTGAVTALGATVAWEPRSRSAVVVPAALLPAGARVDVTLGAGVASPIGASTRAAQWLASFTVAEAGDAAAPVVALVSPPSVAGPADAFVELAFSKSMDVRLLAAPGALKLVDAGGRAIPASLASVSPRSAALALAPPVRLVPGATYTVALTGVADLAGNSPAALGSALTFAVGTAPVTLTAAPAKVSPGAALRLDFSGALEPASVMPAHVVAVDDAAPSVALVASVAALGRTALSLLPAQPWTVGHSYSVALSGVTDVAGRALSGSAHFAAAAGPQLVRAIFARDDGTGAPLGGFDNACLDADGAVLDLPQLPGASSGTCARGPAKGDARLALADMPLWLEYDVALDDTSASSPSAFSLSSGGAAVALAPVHKTGAATVELQPPGGSWLPALTGAFPSSASYQLTPAVKDAIGTATPPRTLRFRTVTVVFYDDGSGAARDVGYGVSGPGNVLTPNDVWSWHAQKAGVAAPAAWVTDAIDADVGRDCQAFPISGRPSTFSFTTPPRFAEPLPTTDVVLRLRHLYSFDPSVGDGLAVFALAGTASPIPIYGAGAARGPSASGQSGGYASSAYDDDEVSLVQSGALPGGAAALPALGGVRAQFSYTSGGARTRADFSCPASAAGWVVGALAVVAY